MAQVELRHVSMDFGPKAPNVLSELSLTVFDGEFLTLLGPSGCGKTTTLNLIAGLLEPSSGDILIAGQRVNGRAPKDRRVAMVFQDYALYPHMTVFENLAFPLRAQRRPRSTRAGVRLAREINGLRTAQPSRGGPVRLRC